MEKRIQHIILKRSTSHDKEYYIDDLRGLIFTLRCTILKFGNIGICIVGLGNIEIENTIFTIEDIDIHKEKLKSVGRLYKNKLKYKVYTEMI